jgi:hypothetical protein
MVPKTQFALCPVPIYVTPSGPSLVLSLLCPPAKVGPGPEVDYNRRRAGGASHHGRLWPGLSVRGLMTRATVLLGCGLFIATALVVTHASGGAFLGHALNRQSTLFYLETCAPLPCWHGIRPGTTSLEAARALLEADGLINVSSADGQLYWHMEGDGPLQGDVTARADGTVAEVRIAVRDRSLLLRRLADWLGDPVAVQCECWDESEFSYARYRVQFPGSAVAYLQAPGRCSATGLGPEHRALTLTIGSAAPLLDSQRGEARPWPGYGPLECLVRRS